MTPTLLSQFLSECRELLEQASRGFLALEKTPDDPAVINDLFRSVHTMKGASGLFDIAPFTAVVHAAEDLLDAVRAGRVVLAAEMTDLFLEGLDQIAQWLDELEAGGALGAGAAEAGKALSGRLRSFLRDGAAAEPPAPAAPAEASDRPPLPWIAALPADVRASLTAELAAGHGPFCAIEYTPHEQAFYSGDDPLFTVLQLPGRRWFEAQPVTPWPAPDDFDPFRCNLRFRAILAANHDALAHHLRYVEDQIALADLRPEDLANGAAGAAAPLAALPAELAEPALDILDSQRQMLETAGDPETWPGRIGSIGVVLARLLAHMDEAAADLPARLEAALAEAGKTRSVAPLVEVIAAARGLVQPAQAAGADMDAVATNGDLPRRRWDDPPAAEPGKEARKTAAIKVDQERIDALMNLAGELIVAKNSLPFLAHRAEDVYGSRPMAREIKAQYEVINRIADDLQTAVMQVRMVPVAHVFQRFNRLVRDLARRLEKQIRLEIEGEETEADKTVVEELADPLVHLMRNSIDHGLETPADRRLAGKPEEGLLRLTARQSEDRVIIEIADDGRGIDVEKVKGQGPGARPDRRGALRQHQRRGRAAADHGGRAFHRRPGVRPVGARRRHGRGSHHGSADRRHDHRAQRSRPRHPGDHLAAAVDVGAPGDDDRRRSRRLRRADREHRRERPGAGLGHPPPQVQRNHRAPRPADPAVPPAPGARPRQWPRQWQRARRRGGVGAGRQRRRCRGRPGGGQLPVGHRYDY